MSHSCKLISLRKPVVLMALVMFCLPGCSSRPATPSGDFDTIKAKTHKLFTEGKYAEAIGPARETVLLAEAKFGKDSPDLADLYAGLARTLQGDKRHADAIPAFEKAIAIYRTLPDNKRELARTLNFLGICLAEYGKDDQALKVMFESVATYADAGLDSSFESLSAVVTLSAVGIKNKKYRESEEVMQIALKVCRNEPDVPPGIYANVLNNIGEVNFLRQDYDTALKYYQEAFDIAEKKLTSRPEVVAVYRKNVENAKSKLKK